MRVPRNAAEAAAQTRADMDAIRAKHPVVLSGEPSRIVLLSEAGAHRTYMWLSDKMRHIDFALVSANRNLDALREAVATGVRPDTASMRMTSDQTRLAEIGNVKRHKALQERLKRNGYWTWITVVGGYRYKDTGADTKEMAMFVPNVVLANNTENLPVEQRASPRVDSATFAAEMQEIADLFVQETHILRVNGTIKLINTSRKQTKKIYSKTHFAGKDAMLKMFKDLNKSDGYFKPRSSGIHVRLEDDRELVDAATFPRTAYKYGQVGVFGMLSLSDSAIADQIIEWVED